MKPVVQKITIKSMNQKIRRVGQRFGIDSLPYKQLVADIERDFRGLTHTTNQGIIQVSQSKKLVLNDYQKQVVNRVANRQGVKEIVSKAKERLNNPKASKEDIDKEVERFTKQQEKFDKTLDIIYDHEVADDLPTDIESTYRKIYRSGKGAGMGVTSNDVEFLENAIIEYEELREELDDIVADIEPKANAGAVKIADEFKNDAYKIKSGQLDMNTIRDVMEKARRYRDQIINLPNDGNTYIINYE